MLKEVFEVSKIAPKRTKIEVLSKMMEEVGELAKEIGIDSGYQNRPKGSDGIKGEIADVINTALDILWLEDPNITEEEFNSIFKVKLIKWKSKCPQIEPILVLKEKDKYKDGGSLSLIDTAGNLYFMDRSLKSKFNTTDNSLYGRVYRGNINDEIRGEHIKNVEIHRINGDIIKGSE